MPTITIRVSAQERAAVEAAAQDAGMSLSAYVRDLFDFARTTRPDFDAWLDDHEKRIESVERRLARVEEIAGI